MDTINALFATFMNAGKFCAILLAGFSIIKITLCMMQHENGQLVSNAAMLVGSAAMYVVFLKLADMTLNFG